MDRRVYGGLAIQGCCPLPADVDLTLLVDAARLADSSSGLTQPHPNSACLLVDSQGSCVGKAFLWAQVRQCMRHTTNLCNPFFWHLRGWHGILHCSEHSNRQTSVVDTSYWGKGLGLCCACYWRRPISGKHLCRAPSQPRAKLCARQARLRVAPRPT